MSKLRAIRNMILKILSFPFYFLLFTIPFFFEKLIFFIIHDRKLKLTDHQNNRTIFLVNSRSGKSFGEVLAKLLKNNYKAKNICDITKEDSFEFLEQKTRQMRKIHQVFSFWRFNFKRINSEDNIWRYSED